MFGVQLARNRAKRWVRRGARLLGLYDLKWVGLSACGPAWSLGRSLPFSAAKPRVEAGTRSTNLTTFFPFLGRGLSIHTARRECGFLQSIHVCWEGASGMFTRFRMDLHPAGKVVRAGSIQIWTIATHEIPLVLILRGCLTLGASFDDTYVHLRLSLERHSQREAWGYLCLSDGCAIGPPNPDDSIMTMASKPSAKAAHGRAMQPPALAGWARLGQTHGDGRVVKTLGNKVPKCRVMRRLPHRHG